MTFTVGDLADAIEGKPRDMPVAMVVPGYQCVAKTATSRLIEVYFG